MALDNLKNHNLKNQGLSIHGANCLDAAEVLSRLIALAPAAKVADLQGPLAHEMITAMQGASVRMDYASDADLLDEILVRLAAISAMAELTVGSYDCDYFNPDIDLKPRIGTTDTTRVSSFWTFLDPQDAWDSQWRQTADTPAARAIAPEYGTVFPFRGECAGAYQLVVYWGLLNGLGAERFAQMAAKFGTMFVGPWRVGKAPNPATLFMPKAPLEDPPIPGDYMYFQNKDDYPDLAPNGFWMGLNSMYMGKDALGTPHYSGMGASWQSESNLRMALSNAYYHDCYPHQIAHPLTEVRFTVRALLQLPKEPIVQTKDSAALGMTTLRAPTAKALKSAGYVLLDNGALTHSSTTLGETLAHFGAAPGHLKQFQSAGLVNPPGRIAAGDTTAVVTFADPQADRTDPAAIVSVHIHTNTAS